MKTSTLSPPCAADNVTSRSALAWYSVTVYSSTVLSSMQFRPDVSTLDEPDYAVYAVMQLMYTELVSC